MKKSAIEIDGKKVRALRNGLVLAQRELAERAGVTRETVAKIEGGERVRSYPATVRKLADALGVEPVDLLKKQSDDREDGIVVHVAITCPECRRERVYSGRGRCACGTYLIHHWSRSESGRPLTIPESRRKKPVYALSNGDWIMLRDKHGEICDLLKPAHDR